MGAGRIWELSTLYLILLWLPFVLVERFRTIFEEVKTAKTNSKANTLFFFFYPGNREIGHMKPGTVSFILSSEQTELKLKTS